MRRSCRWRAPQGYRLLGSPRGLSIFGTRRWSRVRAAGAAAPFLLLGPRHYPRGEAQAILSEGSWQTPLGRAEIDTALATELKRACGALAEDEVAHRDEHALEVQLPFLQVLAGDFRFVPIALGTRDYDALESLGQAIATVLARRTEPVLIVASSDMNHYESDEITRRKDRAALDRVLALDPRGLYDVVRREAISMCGVGRAVSVLTAARLLGATRAELVRYATSGDVSGDHRRSGRLRRHASWIEGAAMHTRCECAQDCRLRCVAKRGCAPRAPARAGAPHPLTCESARDAIEHRQQPLGLGQDALAEVQFELPQGVVHAQPVVFQSAVRAGPDLRCCCARPSKIICSWLAE